MKLQKALNFLENVTNKSMAVPMRRYAGSTGRTAQGECLEFFYMLDYRRATVSRENTMWAGKIITIIFDDAWICRGATTFTIFRFWEGSDDTVVAQNSVWDGNH